MILLRSIYKLNSFDYNLLFYFFKLSQSTSGEVYLSSPNCLIFNVTVCMCTSHSSKTLRSVPVTAFERIIRTTNVTRNKIIKMPQVSCRFNSIDYRTVNAFRFRFVPRLPFDSPSSNGSCSTCRAKNAFVLSHYYGSAHGHVGAYKSLWIYAVVIIACSCPVPD